ncbi:hypothetical protein J4217_00275 [Candidatus Pacearchaeota archaeon]|nr:hypothetical protein [Candidatus Pacearchaeota archaeon]
MHAKDEDRMRNVYRRTEANRLLANIYPRDPEKQETAIREMALVANAYFDSVGAAPSQPDLQAFGEVFDSLDSHLVPRKGYFTQARGRHPSKLSILRLEAAVAIVDRKYGGFQRTRPSGTDLVYPMAENVIMPEDPGFEATRVVPENSTIEGYMEAFERALLNG